MTPRPRVSDVADQVITDALDRAGAQDWNSGQKAALLRAVAFRARKVADTLDGGRRNN